MWPWISSIKVEHISLPSCFGFSHVLCFGQENRAEVTVPGLSLDQMILLVSTWPLCLRQGEVSPWAARLVQGAWETHGTEPSQLSADQNGHPLPPDAEANNSWLFFKPLSFAVVCFTQQSFTDTSPLKHVYDLHFFFFRLPNPNAKFIIYFSLYKRIQNWSSHCGTAS